MTSPTFTADAAALDRAERFLRHQGLPSVTAETDPAYRRGVEAGYQIAMMQLGERARALREVAGKVRAA